MSGQDDVAVESSVTIEIPEQSEAIFTSDLHLGRSSGPQALGPLIDRVGRLGAGSALILGGDILELLNAPAADQPVEILHLHGDFVDAIAAAGRRGVSVVWLIGNHDVRLAWDHVSRVEIGLLLGCRFAHNVDVGFVTAEGEQRVWMEHGHMFDPHNRIEHPGDPVESPLGHHIVREILPMVMSTTGSWADDASFLAMPAGFPDFMSSRFFYRRALRAWPLAVAILAALLLMRVAGTVLINADQPAGGLLKVLTTVVGFSIVDAVVLLAALIAWARRASQGLADDPALSLMMNLNDAIAAGIHTEHPHHVGIVTGHSHEARLVDAPSGFYANPGCSTQSVAAVHARFGLPSVYRRSHELGWLDIGVRSGELVVDLVRGSTPEPAQESWAERHLAPVAVAIAPERVASWPHGPSTTRTDPTRSVRSVRRIAAVVVAIGGLIGSASALSPPLADELQLVEHVLPIEVALAANGVTVLLSLALVSLALGLARGQRRAHRVTVAVLGAVTIGHLVKGADGAEALLSAASMAWLIWVRDRFRVRGNPAPILGTIAAMTAMVALGWAFTLVVLMAETSMSASAALADMIGWVFGSGPLPDNTLQRFTAIGVITLTYGAAVVPMLVVFRRYRDRHRSGLDEARRKVLARGTDSLAYFALRDDKEFFHIGDSVVAFSVFGRVALVSPDPIGPSGDLEAAMGGFRSFAESQGWIVAVLAAAEDRAERYRHMGMRTLYLGDEAVAHFDHLDLSGTHYKGLRGSHNRAVKAGYHVEFLDPAHLTRDQRRMLIPLVSASRRGEAERGFSMTLGRLFDPRDTGLLLAVAWGQDGEAGAFCQFVPASEVGGWSLDVMRRSPTTPNGLIDYLLIETMRHLAAAGGSGLGLNFATMRLYVDPDAPPAEQREGLRGVTTDLERRILQQLSKTFQIESLFRFNEKFDPEWRPRFLVYESALHLPEVATAIAKAESFWEIPVVGRFFVPSEPHSVT